MPEIIVAKSAGYCFGVKRAVNIVQEQVRGQSESASQGKPAKTIYTLGPLIHNKQVIRDLSEQGVVTLADESALESVRDGIVIIRSHGVKRSVYTYLEEHGIECIDATCPFVERIHKIVCEEEKKGNRVVVIGNPDHPEVQGICGWCDGPVDVIRNADEAKAYKAPKDRRLSIVVQTTFQENNFKEIVELLARKGYNTVVLDTICDATRRRQEEAAKIASQVDVMLVVGDASSSNTQKLFEICNTCCTNTYFVQIPEELDLNLVMSVKTVGITAGASTPNYIIEEVQKHVRRKDFV